MHGYGYKERRDKAAAQAKIHLLQAQLDLDEKLYSAAELQSRLANEYLSKAAGEHQFYLMVQKDLP
jgi:hypothetical protein